MLTLPKNTKYVLFDLDGTLAKFPIDYVAMRKELSEYFSIHKKSSGFKPLVQDIKDLAKEVSINDDVLEGRIIKHSFDIIDRHEIASLDNCILIEQVVESYIQCSASPEFKVAIITRNGRLLVDKFLEKYSLPVPDLISSRDDVINMKPDIEQFDFIYKVFQGSRKDYVLIGDSWHDKQLSEKAGMIFIDVKDLYK